VKTSKHSLMRCAAISISSVFLVLIVFGVMWHWPFRAPESLTIWFFVVNAQSVTSADSNRVFPELDDWQLVMVRKCVGNSRLDLCSVCGPIPIKGEKSRTVAVVVSAPPAATTVSLPPSPFAIVVDGQIRFPVDARRVPEGGTLVLKTRATGTADNSLQTTYMFYDANRGGVGGNCIDWEWITMADAKAAK